MGRTKLGLVGIGLLTTFLYCPCVDAKQIRLSDEELSRRDEQRKRAELQRKQADRIQEFRDKSLLLRDISERMKRGQNRGERPNMIEVLKQLKREAQAAGKPTEFHDELRKRFDRNRQRILIPDRSSPIQRRSKYYIPVVPDSEMRKILANPKVNPR